MKTEYAALSLSEHQSYDDYIMFISHLISERVLTVLRREPPEGHAESYLALLYKVIW